MNVEDPKEFLSYLRTEGKAAMHTLFKAYYPLACHIIYRYVSNSEITEDLAQEVFTKFWEKRDSIAINTSIKAYISRMAANTAISYLRKQKAFESIESQEAFSDLGHQGEENMLYAELEDQVNAAIQALPPKCRAIFLLSRYEEKSYKEIAVELDISIKTVENQMGKALRSLRAALANYIS